MIEPSHTLQIKRQKTVADYSNHSLDYLRLIFDSPSPYLTSHEKKIIMTSFGSSYQDHSVLINSKPLLTRLIDLI